MHRPGLEGLTGVDAGAAETILTDVHHTLTACFEAAGTTGLRRRSGRGRKCREPYAVVRARVIKRALVNLKYAIREALLGPPSLSAAGARRAPPVLGIPTPKSSRFRPPLMDVRNGDDKADTGWKGDDRADTRFHDDGTVDASWGGDDMAKTSWKGDDTADTS